MRTLKYSLMHVLTSMHVSIINRVTTTSLIQNCFNFSDADDIGSFLIVLNKKYSFDRRVNQFMKCN